MFLKQPGTVITLHFIYQI